MCRQALSEVVAVSWVGERPKAGSEGSPEAS